MKDSSAEGIKLDYYFLCIPSIAPSYNNRETMTILYRNYLNTPAATTIFKMRKYVPI